MENYEPSTMPESVKAAIEQEKTRERVPTIAPSAIGKKIIKTPGKWTTEDDDYLYPLDPWTNEPFIRLDEKDKFKFIKPHVLYNKYVIEDCGRPMDMYFKTVEACNFPPLKKGSKGHSFYTGQNTCFDTMGKHKVITWSIIIGLIFFLWPIIFPCLILLLFIAIFTGTLNSLVGSIKGVLK